MVSNSKASLDFYHPQFVDRFPYLILQFISLNLSELKKKPLETEPTRAWNKAVRLERLITLLESDVDLQSQAGKTTRSEASGW